MTKSSIFIFLAIFLFSFVIFYAHIAMVGSAVWGDGQYYYSYLRSAVLDGDLNFKNELEHFSRPIVYTKTGMIANKYSIGPALLWLPFFLIGHWISLIGQIGVPDGYSLIYELSTGAGAIFYGVLGLIFCFKICRRYFSRKIPLFAVMAIWCSSNLFFYTLVDPINSHSVSFFMASLFLFLWLTSDGRKIYQLFLLGIAGGILGMIRNQDLIYTLPVIIRLINTSFKKSILKIFIFLSGIFLSLIPQIVVWYILYGELANPYLSKGENFYLLNPQILLVLFNTTNGLFLYSPILGLSLFGFFFLYKKSQFLALSGIFLFLIQLYVISSWHYWTQGASYGGRMFISLMPYFILGFAAFTEKYKLMYKKIIILVLIFTLINMGSIIRFLIVNP